MQKRVLMLGLLILSFSNISAQQKAKKGLKTSNVNSESVLPENVEIDQENKKYHDSIIYNLQDIQFAREKDSLWLQRIYESDLFDEVYNTIAQNEMDDVVYDELSTEVLRQRLKELDARTPFRVEYNPSLENVIKHYLKNRKQIMQRLMNLSEYYFPMFEEELDRQNLPLELKYLAVIESALNPKARSRVGATGLWQFMFATGKMFGLDVNSYVDERSDPIKSTVAAATYLKSLNESFEDWDLALAAYNYGPGNVSKAIRRSGGATDYWTLRHYLPRETAGYVPAFLATMYIFEYAKEHGFERKNERIPYLATDTVQVKRQMSLEQIAQMTNLDKQEIEFLNPSYKLGIIPVVKGKDYYLRLPITALGTFVSNEEIIYAYLEEQKASKEESPVIYEPEKIRYRVKNGDYLGRIANLYGVTVGQIKTWNGLRNNNLKIGQNLIIYKNHTPSAVASNTAVATSSGGEKIYTVKAGDTLWAISRKFPGVSVENLKKWNGISGNNLKPGTKLKIQKG